MFWTPGGSVTQPCLRDSQTDTSGSGNDGSANAPTAIAIRSGPESSR